MSRQMLQPPKDVLRTALSRAHDLIEKQAAQIAELKADKPATGIAFVAGSLVGAMLTVWAIWLT